MCGIVTYVGRRPAVPLVVDGLRRLEYRGYDSAGLAVPGKDGQVIVHKAPGRVDELVGRLPKRLTATTAIAHTRWATHGAPTETNAHPHATARVAVVHNGIIENHAELRAELERAGQVFVTETDTETVVQLVDLLLQQGATPVEAARAALARLHGAYALAMVFSGHPDLMVGARHGPPLAVGFGEDEMFVGSDALALAPL
ncbi:MAG: class II glutamine amidotransferase, partial [Actinobacteria bacterium]|nr:class II glutamine amidotransferase [Actinomycetota bacterium]